MLAGCTELAEDATESSVLTNQDLDGVYHGMMWSMRVSMNADNTFELYTLQPYECFDTNAEAQEAIDYENAQLADEDGDHADNIASEYTLTKRLVLKITGKSRLLSADPALQLSVDLRNRTIVPLGFLQVALLKRLRDQNRQPPMSESPDMGGDTNRTYSRSELLRGALLTINGIAAGMRNTG